MVATRVFYLDGYGDSNPNVDTPRYTSIKNRLEATKRQGITQQGIIQRLNYNRTASYLDVLGNLQGQVNRITTTPGNCIFVGESMGGFLAARLAKAYNARTYLINPLVWAKDPNGVVKRQDTLEEVVNRPKFINQFTSDQARQAYVNSYAAVQTEAYVPARTRNSILSATFDGVLLSDSQGFYGLTEPHSLDLVPDEHAINRPETFDLVAARINRLLDGAVKLYTDLVCVKRNTMPSDGRLHVIGYPTPTGQGGTKRSIAIVNTTTGVEAHAHAVDMTDAAVINMPVKENDVIDPLVMFGHWYITMRHYSGI